MSNQGSRRIGSESVGTAGTKCKGVHKMAKQLDISLPSTNSLVKTAIALVVILMIVRMTPDTWGIKKWFMPI